MTVEQIDNGLKSQINRALIIVQSIADCIRELGSTPSGHLYAQLIGTISIEEYQASIRILKDAGCISESNSQLLTWILDK